MTPRTRGFTLIEQAAVLTTIGLLASIALPRLQSLREDASALALTQVASSAGLAMLANRGTCTVGGAARADLCQPVRNCHEVHTLLHQPLPEAFVVQPAPLPTDGLRHAGAECTVVHQPSGTVARFRGYAAGV